MQPGMRKGGAILETFHELNESADALDRVPGQHADDLSQTLDREPPYEVSAVDVWVIMKGLELVLSSLDDSDGDYRKTLEQLKSEYEKVTSPEHQEEIIQWFVHYATPSGGAPEEIRDQWIGVPLPVRQSNITEASHLGGHSIGANILDPTDVKVNNAASVVVVNAIDAFKALRLADREEAAKWWEAWFLTRHPMLGTRLIFQSADGDFRFAEEIDHILPGINEFDALQPASSNEV